MRRILHAAQHVPLNTDTTVQRLRPVGSVQAAACGVGAEAAARGASVQRLRPVGLVCRGCSMWGQCRGCGLWSLGATAPSSTAAGCPPPSQDCTGRPVSRLHAGLSEVEHGGGARMLEDALAAIHQVLLQHRVRLHGPKEEPKVVVVHLCMQGSGAVSRSEAGCHHGGRRA